MLSNETEQPIAAQTKAEILKLLYQIEQATAEVYPLSSQFAKLMIEKQDKETNKKSCEAGSSKLLSFITLGIAVAVGIYSFFITNSNLLKCIGAVFCIFMLLLALFLFASAVSNKNAAKRLNKEIPELDRQMEIVLKQLSDVMNRHQNALQLRKQMCPEACSDPKYLRLYISYLETSQADTLKEAWALFDTQMHRDRMEGLAKEQLRAAQDAYHAAEQALSAANAAKDSADKAANAARQASFDVKFK